MDEYEDEIIKKAISLENEDSLQTLVECLKDKKVVMLGEASHGTQEFYKWRKLISQELISSHGFRCVAVEGDWPACQKINKFIQGIDQGDAHKVLSSFDRWPSWMWANHEMLEFTQWLKDWNDQTSEKVSFHGLDVYSFYESMDQVIELLKTKDPELSKLAEKNYACLAPFRHDEKSYVRSLFKVSEGCKREVLDVLNATLQKKLNAHQEKDFWFDVRQNAQIVANAENYYRAMVFMEEDSWNVREKHMVSTLEMILEHYGSKEKIIIWAHNTHVGDYRATDMVTSGHFNIGGMAREIYGSENVALVGFGSYQGQVTASYMWNGPILQYDVPEARPGSIEHACHKVISKVGCEQFYMVFDPHDHGSILNSVVGHRAIGVVYDPDLEHRGNYVPTSLANRYDAFIFLDRTKALIPLEVHVDKRKFPETYPFGNRM